ncbi:SGNH/GDSL hydrolase family protein [Streptomyces sp. NPDC004838]
MRATRPRTSRTPHTPRTSRLTLAATAAAASLLTAVPATAAPANAAPAAQNPGADSSRTGDSHTGGPDRWSAAWASGLVRPTAPLPWSWPNWAWDGFADQSLRQVVRVGAAGAELRIRVSNRYGTRPLELARATVARAGEGPALAPGSVREVRFDGRAQTAIPGGGERYSDPVRLPVSPLERVTVTLHFRAATGPAALHEDGLTTAYRASGDAAGEVSGASYGETSESRYLLSGVEVRGIRNGGGVAAFGDSITDGWGSTPGTDRRYPDRLADRLLADGRRNPVVNAGVSGNMLLTDSACYGEKGVARFRHDVTERPGVRTAVVLIGINDIGGGGADDWGCGSAPRAEANRLIDGYRQLIRAAHQRGITVVGATLTPFKGYAPYYSPEKEAVRDAVNHWIRTGGEFDAVADTDRALADPRPGHGDELAPGYDSGDGIHPNDAGMDALATVVKEAAVTDARS